MYDKYFMINNAFGNPQCIICYKTFKNHNLKVFERHFHSFHNDVNNLNENEKQKLFDSHKNIFVEKLKEWLMGLETNKPNSTKNNLRKKVSSLISYELVKQGRPFTDGNFIKQIFEKVLGMLNCNLSLITPIPLSRITIVRRSLQIGIYIESVIRQTLENCVFFSFCLDESTDVNNLCQLIICIRCVDADSNVFETMFELETFYSNVTGKVLFDVVCNKLLSIVDPNKLTGVCTDGANVMIGKNEGLVGQLKRHGFEVPNFHCFIHQAALASKFLSECPAMKTAERIINKIRGGHHSLTHRKFKQFLKNKNASHTDLKMFTEVRWLSRGCCLNRLFDLREEVKEFLEIENMEEYFSMKDDEFISDIAFLADTTSFLNEFILELQGKGKNIYELHKSLSNFKTKLYLLLLQIQSDDFSNFPKTLKICANKNILKRNEYVVLFETLFFNFENRFKDLKYIKPLLDLFADPFSCAVCNYECQVQVELIILRSEVQPPNRAEITHFWKNLDGSIYPELKAISLKVLSYFPTTYLCEQIFSDLKFVCSKQRNSLTSVNLKNILLTRNCHNSIDIEKFITQAT